MKSKNNLNQQFPRSLTIAKEKTLPLYIIKRYHLYSFPLLLCTINLVLCCVKKCINCDRTVLESWLSHNIYTLPFFFFTLCQKLYFITLFHMTQLYIIFIIIFGKLFTKFNIFSVIKFMEFLCKKFRIRHIVESCKSAILSPYTLNLHFTHA